MESKIVYFEGIKPENTESTFSLALERLDLLGVKKLVLASTTGAGLCGTGYLSCSKAMVVTNSFYTKPAIELAKANDVQLWDRNDLVKALLSVKKDEPIPQAYTEVAATQDIADVIIQPPLDQDECAVCGKKVSEKVKQYCLENSKRFGGSVYCYEHQREK